MRRSCLFLLIAIAACSPQLPGSPTNATAEAPVGSMRHAETKTSSGAVAARALVVRYFDLIKARDYGGARKLWGHGGADSGGDATAFAKAFARYSIYEPTVGEPTDVRVAEGKQFVNVAVVLHVKVAETGKVIDQEGPVMLSRSIDPKATDPDSRDWRIWGVDIRRPH